jgi:site-specific DNA recombinase
MTMAATVPAVRRVATYARVSSDDQAMRGTIQTQIDTLERRLASEPDAEIVARYIDDGVSGTIPMDRRPGGGKLMADAIDHQFDELWVLATDRLGRDAPDVLRTRRLVQALGIRLMTPAGECNPLVTDIEAVIGDYVRVKFLADTARGIDRAARAGLYPGGIVALGYRAEGENKKARLVPDDSQMWADLSAADLVRQIYERLARRGQSCHEIAAEFNAMGVPTAYTRDGREVAKVRGQRKERTQNLWRSGRIRNLVVSTTYRGELQYGRRVAKGRPAREIISARMEPLVSEELWYAAQAALAANRRIPKNTRRVYLLRGAMTCGTCGLNYVGSWSKDFGWYRCGGQLKERGPIPGKCTGVSIRTDKIEPAVWADIEAWLRNPGDLLDELDGAGERESAQAIAAADVATLRRALESLADQKARLVKSVRMGVLSNEDVGAELNQIGLEREALEARLAAAQAPVAEVVPQEVRNLLLEVRARLDAGLTDEERQEIVRLLVRIVVYTTVGEDAKKTARAAVTYRFPADEQSVVPVFTGTGSLPRSTGNATGRRRLGRPWRWRPGRPPEAGAAPPTSRGRIRAARRGTARRCSRGSLPPGTCAVRRRPLPHTRRCGVATGTVEP